MMNCRSVSPKAWEHARQALIFYFTRRHGLSGAEDLAHETLTAVLSREDYEFEKEEDFLKVCYGFAGHVSQTALRKAAKRSSSSLDSDVASPDSGTQGLKDAEMDVFVKEVCEVGKAQLRDTDWGLIQRSIVLDGDRPAGRADPAEANNSRVKLHRARKRLALLVGWRRV